MHPKSMGPTTLSKYQRTEDFESTWDLGVKGELKSFLGM